MDQSPAPLTPRSINRSTPIRAERKSPFKSPQKQSFTLQDTENIPLSSPDGPPSSPLVENVDSSPPRPTQSPSKQQSPQNEAQQEYERRDLTEDALKENDGLSNGTPTQLDDTSRSNDYAIDDDTASNVGGAPGYTGMDDTAFSAFSAVPNVDMTRFARLGQASTKLTSNSPTKSIREDPTPRPTSRHTPSRDRHHYDDSYYSPTPRRHQRENSSHDDDTTNLLVDFTGKLNSIPPLSERSPTKSSRLSPTKYHNDLSLYAASRRTPSPSKYANTPSDTRRLGNLLDFDLPPAPTPRSMPSISARELESMKSTFQSQISSLKAELSGKEAEVSSLKAAMNNAEERVGEAQEQVREERGAKEGLEAEKTAWEKREQEMKDVLRNVKEEIVHSDREKDNLLQRVTDAECKREESEAKLVEAESKIAGLQASSPKDQQDSSSSSPNKPQNQNTSNEVEAAVTKVAKELHTLYKSKHEAKVTALKKSYSDRWEKKIATLTTQLESLTKENEDLRTGRDATITGVNPTTLISNPNTTTSTEQAEAEAERERERERQSEQEAKLASQTQHLTSLQSELQTLRSSLSTSQDQTESLQSQLQSSRAETADLIAATEELMSLSQNAMSSSQSSHSSQPFPSSQSTQDLRTSTETMRPAATAHPLPRSTSGSGLKVPGFGESRIGGLRAPQAGGMGRERSGSGKSGLLGNIERMGRGGGGGMH